MLQLEPFLRTLEPCSGPLAHNALSQDLFCGRLFFCQPPSSSPACSFPSSFTGCLSPTGCFSTFCSSSCFLGCGFALAFSHGGLCPAIIQGTWFGVRIAHKCPCKKHQQHKLFHHQPLPSSSPFPFPSTTMLELELEEEGLEVLELPFPPESIGKKVSITCVQHCQASTGAFSLGTFSCWNNLYKKIQ